MAYRFVFRLKGGQFQSKHEFRLRSDPYLLGDTLAQAARDLNDFVALLTQTPKDSVNPDKVELVSCWRDTTRLDKGKVREAMYQQVIKERELKQRDRDQQPAPRTPVRPPAGPVAPAKRPTIWDHRRKK